MPADDGKRKDTHTDDTGKRKPDHDTGNQRKDRGGRDKTLSEDDETNRGSFRSWPPRKKDSGG